MKAIWCSVISKTQGVETETGSIFPLKYLFPFKAKSAMNEAISAGFNGAEYPGKALVNISV